MVYLNVNNSIGEIVNSFTFPLSEHTTHMLVKYWYKKSSCSWISEVIMSDKWVDMIMNLNVLNYVNWHTCTSMSWLSPRTQREGKWYHEACPTRSIYSLLSKIINIQVKNEKILEEWGLIQPHILFIKFLVMTVSVNVELALEWI